MSGLSSMLAALGSLGETLEERQFNELYQYGKNLHDRIQALPAGDAKKSFVSTFYPVATNIEEIKTHQDYIKSPALFASEYKTNMQVLKYLDQQLAARTAEPTVIPDTPVQPQQSLQPFTQSGGSTPLDPSSILWRTPSVAATVDSWPMPPAAGPQDSSSFLKPILVILAVGAVGYVVFTQIKKRGKR